MFKAAGCACELVAKEIGFCTLLHSTAYDVDNPQIKHPSRRDHNYDVDQRFIVDIKITTNVAHFQLPLAVETVKNNYKEELLTMTGTRHQHHFPASHSLCTCVAFGIFLLSIMYSDYILEMGMFMMFAGCQTIEQLLDAIDTLCCRIKSYLFILRMAILNFLRGL
jgi:hypothetical protein